MVGVNRDDSALTKAHDFLSTPTKLKNYLTINLIINPSIQSINLFTHHHHNIYSYQHNNYVSQFP